MAADPFYRTALAELIASLSTERSVGFAWITAYWTPDGADPVRRAWESCCVPQVMLKFLRVWQPMDVVVDVMIYGVDHSLYRTDGADDRRTTLRVRDVPLPRGPSGYEVDHLGLFTIVLPTACDVIRFFHPAPSLDAFIGDVASLGDA